MPVKAGIMHDNRWMELRVILDRYEYGRLLDVYVRAAEAGTAKRLLSSMLTGWVVKARKRAGR